MMQRKQLILVNHLKLFITYSFYCYCYLYVLMLDYDVIYIFEGIDIKRTSDLHECRICLYNYFLR